MKGVVFLGERECLVKDLPDPIPEAGQVRVKLKSSGICGSDLHVYRGLNKEDAKKRGDRIPGHEPSGVVESLGSGVRHLKEGDRVSIYHYLACGYCKQCASGYLQWCSQAKGLGGPIDGGHADLIIADERNCVLLPDSLSFSDGAFIACAGGTAYSAMQKLEVSGNDCIAIFGLGPVGLSGLLVAKAMGGKVIGIDISSDRLALARQLGADAVANPNEGDALETVRKFSGGEGVDLAFEASGSAQGRQQIAAGLRRGGKAVFAGVGSNEKTLNLTEIIGRQLTLMGTFVLPLWMAWELVHFLTRHQLSFAPAATHFFPIDKAPEAYRLADEGKTGKVVFTWE